ncbi:hypothetical protein [Acidovorax sp. SRB_24]|uniref:hypothetical protein n=1 Tax=Acidovorax sp. SRB_24 TaxID=1962700 RepID=UPI00145EAA33|nr:hypothetical protein [Acidovorax sp. SRB_24]NMM76803.1 hypothetical protein [Acidovorax sp. SRB_24]
MQNKFTHHHMTAEEVNDQHGPAIMLTQQDGIDEPHCVLVHPWQLRAVCEQFGIIANDSQAAKTIATLQRRMMGLCDRIESLVDWMALHSDHRHADLSYEMTQLHALHDLAGEWCADFDSEQAEPAVESDSIAAECTNAPAAQAKLL